jgi:YesN/AraC family two-component response regulator
MIQRLFLIAALFFTLFSFGKASNSHSEQDKKFFLFLMQLSPQQLYDTADYYFSRNSFDTALICYHTFINTPVKNKDIEYQKKIIYALKTNGLLYYYMGDYRNAYENNIKALDLCETYNQVLLKPSIYNNLGNIYYGFGKFDVAKSYYLMALNFCDDDNVNIIGYLNNIGNIWLKLAETDSAFYYLNKAYEISKQNNNIYLDVISCTIAEIYQQIKQYDTAYYYYKLSLEISKNNNEKQYIAQYLHHLSKLFFETNKLDSALFYINLSNSVASEILSWEVVAENNLTLSRIEDIKGNTEKSYGYYKIYTNLKDSVSNKFNEVNQLRNLYEISKINRQIEQLIIEQQIKDRTIYLQKIIYYILSGVLVLVAIMLYFLFRQNKKLKKSYEILFDKNIEIVNMYEGASIERIEKSDNNNAQIKLSQEAQNELLDKILNVMENSDMICDTTFDLAKLTKLVESNQLYVSYVINNKLKKNFNSLLNGYRIKEAQRLLADFDIQTHTIEAIVTKVGFNSRSAFYKSFKDITGISPGFYIKSYNAKYPHKSL